MPHAYISRDAGTASTGGASSTQMVEVTGKDGVQFEAHAKFAEACENGHRGLAAELLASKLAVLVGANVPRTHVVELREEPVIRLRNGMSPAPGLAVASETITPWVDVNGPDALKDISIVQLASLSVFESWIEATDRGHNMIRRRDEVFAIDFASAFGGAFTGTTAAPSLVEDGLLRDRVSDAHSAMRDAAERLCAVSDQSIDDAVEDVPNAWIGDDIKVALKARVKFNRQAVSDQITNKHSRT